MKPVRRSDYCSVLLKRSRETPSTDVKGDTKSTGFSWVFGLGYELPSGFGLHARFNLGLTEIAKATNT